MPGPDRGRVREGCQVACLSSEHSERGRVLRAAYSSNWRDSFFVSLNVRMSLVHSNRRRVFFRSTRWVTAPPFVSNRFFRRLCHSARSSPSSSADHTISQHMPPTSVPFAYPSGSWCCACFAGSGLDAFLVIEAVFTDQGSPIHKSPTSRKTNMQKHCR